MGFFRKHRSKLILSFLIAALAWGFPCSYDLSLPLAFAASSSWTQSDWSGGVGPNTIDEYASATNLDTSAPDQITLESEADWFDLDWKHRKEITVTNTGAVQIDYQIKLIVPYDSEMQTNFDDLRFTNESGVELDHWIHDKTDSVEATVWVEVDDLAGLGDTIIFMYFGNDTATNVSSGEDTFLFFDDFDDDVIDPVKWTVIDSEGQISEAGGKLLFERLDNGSWNKAVIGNTTFARSDLSFDFDYQWMVNNPSYDALMFGWHDSGVGASYSHLVYAFYNSSSGGSSTTPAYIYENGNGRGASTAQWTVTDDYDVRVRMRETGGAFYEQSEDGGDTWSTSYTSVYSTEGDLKLGWSFYSGTHEFDNARVRKWMDTEPTTSFGTTENRYANSGNLISSILDSNPLGSIWGTLTYTSGGVGTVAVMVRTSNDIDMAGALDFATCDVIVNGLDISNNNCVSDGHRYMQYRVDLMGENADTPILQEFSLSFEDAAAIANAGQDFTMAAGRSVELDGSASSGTGLSYNWALISGDGSLENIQSAAPTLTVSAAVENQDIEIHLTVRNVMGDTATDELVVHLIGKKFAREVSSGIVGDVGGTIIYERKDEESGAVSLVAGNSELILPEGTDKYTLAATSQNHLIIGTPNADSDTGKVYLLKQSFENLVHIINMNDAHASGKAPSEDVDPNQIVGNEKQSPHDSETVSVAVLGNRIGDLFGQYLSAGDIDGDGSDELLVGAPGAADFGMVYIYDFQLNLQGVLVGTANYPLNSLFIDNYLSTGSNSVTFGPGNPALNINLTPNSEMDIEYADFAFTLFSSNYFEGVTVLDSEVVNTTTGVGSSYQSIYLGDLNDGGFSDLVLASNEGDVYIFFGQQSAHSNLPITDANVVISGCACADLFGYSSTMGDVSGDGITDVIIGAPNYGEGEEGALFVLFGVPSWGDSIDVMTDGHVLKLSGYNPGDRIGRDILLADENGDGTKEIYTISGTDTVIKFDLLNSEQDIPFDPDEEIKGGSGGCSLLQFGAPPSNFGLFLFGVLSIVAILFVRVFRRMHNIKGTSLKTSVI